MIHFKDFRDGNIQLKELTESLRSAIPIEDFFMLSEQELAHKALRQFNFRKLEPTKESISSYAQKVIDVTGFLKNTDEPITYFVRIFLNAGKDIIAIRNQLQLEATTHLRQVEELLEHYHTLPFISKYRSVPTTPRNNEERKQLEFYKRTISKREEIISYLLKGVLHRAYDKAVPRITTNLLKEYGEISKRLERHEDFPYLDLIYGAVFKYELDLEKLDYRRINPLRNKIKWLGKLSDLDKGDYTPEINAEFEHNIQSSTFFDSIISRLLDIPVVRERVDIFQEMEQLFLEKKWFSLYALALPQVEGIFSELLEMMTSKIRNRSLTEKVNGLRKYYESSGYTFDYYEYTLADLRNKFSHTGKVDKPKEKCHHLLIDISYLLNIGTELNIPLSKISSLIKKGKEYGFEHIGAIGDFIRLLQQIEKDGKLLQVKQMADDLVYGYTLKKMDFKKRIHHLQEDFQVSLAKFETTLGMLMHVEAKRPPFKLFSFTIKEIKPKLKDIETGLNKYPWVIYEDLKLLLDTKYFLHYFIKFFPKAQKAVKDSIAAFKNQYERELGILHFLEEHSKFQLPDDFLLLTDNLRHRLKDS